MREVVMEHWPVGGSKRGVSYQSGCEKRREKNREQCKQRDSGIHTRAKVSFCTLFAGTHSSERTRVLAAIGAMCLNEASLIA